MPETDPLRIFAHRLAQLGGRYMVTGSVAATLYGEPRLTNDVDIVVALTDADADTLPNLFAAREFYLPPPEVVRVEMSRKLRGHFNIIHHDSGLKADIYLQGDDPLHTWGLNHAKKLDLLGLAIFIAPPEYVIVRKLEFYREGGSEKHLGDIRAMLKASQDIIDIAILDQLTAERGLADLWASLQPRG